MTLAPTTTPQEEQLRLQVNSLQTQIRQLTSQLVSQQSPPSDAIARFPSPGWLPQPSRASRASMDAAVGGQYGATWRATPRTRRAFSQQERPVYLMSRSTSRNSDLDTLPTYNGNGASFTSAPSVGVGSSRPASVNGPLASVDENSDIPDVGIKPCNYVSRNWCAEQSFLASEGTYLSPDDAQSSFVPSAPPSMISGFSAAELPQPLTRQNSSSGVSTGADMLRVPSNQSHCTDNLSVRGSQRNAGSDFCGVSSACDTDFLAIGSKFVPATPQDYPPSTPSTNLFLSPSMERTVSNTSIASTKSTGSNSELRLRDARERHLQNGKTEIRPKVAGPHQIRVPSTSKKVGKLPIQKKPYQRHKGPKVYCHRCSDHPEGFRGDHELRRHLNAKHRGVVKKYMCRDPALAGLVPGEQVLQPLSECKACAGGKKYGAYYNAAAHLRRTHFKPKAPRGKNKTPDDEKRGGKGGGDWPPMSELKLWFVEVLVNADGIVTETSADIVEVAESAQENDDVDWIFDCDAEGDFDMPFQGGVNFSSHNPDSMDYEPAVQQNYQPDQYDNGVVYDPALLDNYTWTMESM